MDRTMERGTHMACGACACGGARGGTGGSAVENQQEWRISKTKSPWHTQGPGHTSLRLAIFVDGNLVSWPDDRLGVRTKVIGKGSVLARPPVGVIPQPAAAYTSGLRTDNKRVIDPRGKLVERTIRRGAVGNNQTKPDLGDG